MNLTVDLNGWKKPGRPILFAYGDVIDPFYRVIFKREWALLVIFHTYNMSKPIS